MRRVFLSALQQLYLAPIESNYICISTDRWSGGGDGFAVIINAI